MLQFVLSRNKQLPHLLVAPRLDDEHADSTLSLFPTMFLCAMQAPRMAPHYILTGLQVCSVSLDDRRYLLKNST
jgi:hypothetical protein